MACVEANALPEAGKARRPAADGFNEVECSDTSFQYRLSRRGSTRLKKLTIVLPIREFYKSIQAPLCTTKYYGTNVQEDV